MYVENLYIFTLLCSLGLWVKQEFFNFLFLVVGWFV